MEPLHFYDSLNYCLVINFVPSIFSELNQVFKILTVYFNKNEFTKMSSQSLVFDEKMNK